MRRSIFSLFAVIALPAAGQVAQAPTNFDDVPIATATELRDWCRDESQAYFVGHGDTPYNWTASDVVRGNAFHVDGRWRVDGVYYDVKGRITAGAMRRYAVIDIQAAK